MQQSLFIEKKRKKEDFKCIQKDDDAYTYEKREITYKINTKINNKKGGDTLAIQRSTEGANREHVYILRTGRWGLEFSIFFWMNLVYIYVSLYTI